VKTLKGRPFWMRDRGRAQRINKDGGGRAVGTEEEGPSNHNSDYCDMCQFVGGSCRKGNKVASKIVVDANTGVVFEKFVSLFIK
jgi:hypothetical protein